jgi:hypothetical protein
VTVRDVAERLGGKRLLPREVRTELNLARDMLPARALDRIVEELGENAWLRAGRSLALEVPDERNVILDPRYPANAGVRLVSSRPFVPDPRLLS